MYLLRRMMAKCLVDEGLDWRADMYFCSLSSRTIVYKGMTSANVRRGRVGSNREVFVQQLDSIGNCVTMPNNL